MADTIITTLGALTGPGSSHPVRSASGGSHTIALRLSGTGALVFAGALEGANDPAGPWSSVATLNASGNDNVAASSNSTTDYAFWRATANTLTGTSVQAVVRVSSDPVVGMGNSSSPSTSGAVFVPLTEDYTGIQVAISACVAVGGGTVQFKPGAIYNIGDNELTPVAGVHFVGGGMGTRMDDPSIMTGTIIRSTSTTKPIIGFNYVDRAAPYAAPKGSGGVEGFFDKMIQNVQIRDLMLDGGAYGVKIGALYEAGIQDLFVQNVASINATVGGIWLENCHTLHTHNTRCYDFGQYGFVYYASGASFWNMGQNVIDHPVCQSPSRNAHKIIIAGRGTGTSLNDTHLYNGCAIGGETLFTESVVVTAGNANIPVSDLSKYGIGCGVMFQGSFGTVSGLVNSANRTNNASYFVKSRSGSTGAGTIQISQRFGGAVITPGGTGTATVTLGGRGGVGILMGSDESNGVPANATSLTARSIDIEASGTVALLVQGAVYSHFMVGILPTNDTPYGTNIAVRSIGTDTEIHAVERPRNLDWDGSGYLTYDGPLPWLYETNNQGQISIAAGRQYDTAKFGHRLALSNEGSIYANRTGGASGLRPLIGLDSCFQMWTQETNEANQLGSHSSCVTYFGAAGSTFTLRGTTNANDDSKGFFLYFFNSNAFGTTPVVVSGGGLNIRGKGASGSTISVPGDTGVILQLMKRNGVYFWAQFS